MTNREKTLSIVVLIVLIAAFFFYGGWSYVQSLVFAPEEELAQDLAFDVPQAPQTQPEQAPQFVDPAPIPAPAPTTGQGFASTSSSTTSNDQEDTNVEEYTQVDSSAAAQKERDKVLAGISLRQTLSQRATVLELQNKIDSLLADRARTELEITRLKLQFERDKLQLQSQTEQLRLTSKIALDDLKRGGPLPSSDSNRRSRSVKLLGLLPSGEVVMDVQGQTVKLLPGQSDNGVKVVAVNSTNQSVKVVVDGTEKVLSSGR